jgi:hypothetical protein
MWKRAACRCSLEVSMANTISRPAWRAATASMTGASERQGPQVGE